MTRPETTTNTGDKTCVLPTMEALMAGTLALMTGCAQAHSADPNRQLLARKRVSQLFFLSEHPQVAAPMRCVLRNLRLRWQQEAARDALVRQAVPDPTPLWHTAPGALQ